MATLSPAEQGQLGAAKGQIQKAIDTIQARRRTSSSMRASELDQIVRNLNIAGGYIDAVAAPTEKENPNV